MGARATETKICNGKVTLHPDSVGRFDELLADGKIHFEMMDDKSLWIGIYPKGEKKACVHVWVGSGTKIKVTVQDA